MPTKVGSARGAAGRPGLDSGLLESPLILSANFLFLLGSEVVLNVECLSDLLGRLALNHVSHSLTGQIQQVLDVEVVRSL